MYNKEQIDLIKEFLQEKYDITITSTAKVVRLDKAEIDIVSSDDDIIYFGEVITVDANGSVKLSIKEIGSGTVITFDNTTGPGVGLPNQSYAPNSTFNHCEQATTGEPGNIYFFGIKFNYTKNV